MLDKWEFVNEHFKRGQRELRSEIRRWKTVTTGMGGKSGASMREAEAEADLGI